MELRTGLIRLAVCWAISCLLHIGLVLAIAPHAAQPMRSVGITARLSVAPPGALGSQIATPAPTSRRVAASSSHAQESLPETQARRAVLIPETSFSLQAETGVLASRDDGDSKRDWLALGIPEKKEKYYSAGEVDIRAEPLIDIVPPGLGDRHVPPKPERLKLRLLIDEFGQVTAVEILEASPAGELALAMTPYIRSIRFNPARINSIAVKSEKIIEIFHSTDTEL